MLAHQGQAEGSKLGRSTALLFYDRIGGIASMKKKLPTPQKLPSGMWRCQVMVGGRRVSVVEENPSVAQAKALALKNGLIEEKKNPKAITVNEAVERYIESKDSVLSPSTLRGYKSIQKNSLGKLKDVKIGDVTQEAVQRHINALSKDTSPKYVRNVHGLLSASLAAYRPDFQLHTTLPQKEKKEIQIPTMEEIQFIAEKARGTSFELPFLLATWVGLRTSEIRGLTWDCIKGDVLHIRQAMVEGEDGPVLKTTKSYSGNRKIKISSYIVDLINKQPHVDEYIIHYSRNALYNHLRRMCDRYDLPHYRFHDLRHVQASVMLALGVPDKYAMERMGHSSTNMLKTVYQHTMKSKSEEVANKVDGFFSEKLHTNLHTDN